MFLIILPALLSFISVHSSFVGKAILKWVNKPSMKEKQLMTEKNTLKEEQAKITITENFAKYSKIQRRINGIDAELSKFRNEKNSLTLQYGLTYGLKILLSLFLMILSIYYRYRPVFTVSSSIDLMPFNFIVCYPNENNHVSFHFWVLCCSTFARIIKI